MSCSNEFAAHCESFRPYLMVLAGAHVGPQLRGQLDPADLVQQALLKAYQGRANFRGEGAAQLCAWLRTILANLVVDGHRKFGGVPGGRVGSLDALLDESSRRLVALLEDGGSSPSHKLGRQERAHLVAEALARLPEDQRTAVDLRHLRGASVERIAEQMGRSVPAVAGLLRRGLRALRNDLEALA